MRPSLWLDRRFFLGVAVAVHLVAALCSGGWYALDEHFQTIEFAGYRLGFNQPSELSWEFHHRMRPALQPAVADLVIRACRAAGSDDPFVAATVLRLLSGALGLASVYLLYLALAGRLRSDRARAWLAACSCLLWFLPYQHVRFASESWSGAFFWSGAALVWMLSDSDQGARRRALAWLAAGALLGLAFVARPQSGLLILPVVVWLGWRRRRAAGGLPLAWTLVGATLAVAFGVLLDRWFYGEWTLSAWNYFRVNLQSGAAGHFGREPWWFYLQRVAERSAYPVGLAILLSACMYLFLKPRDRLTWTLVPFLLVHMLIAHKETRFLFPLVNIVPFVLVSAGEAVASWPWLKRSWWSRRLLSVALAATVVLNLALLTVASLKPADPVYALYRFLYRHYGSSGQVRLFYDSENPYARAHFTPALYPRGRAGELDLGAPSGPDVVLEARFYKPPWLETAPWNPNAYYRGVCLYVSRGGGPPSVPGLQSMQFRRVYTYLPEWMRRFNFTGWIERTQNWSVWEVIRVRVSLR